MQHTPPATAITIVVVVVLLTTTATTSIGSLTNQPHDETWFPEFAQLEQDPGPDDNTYAFTWDDTLPTADYRRFETITLPALPGTPLEVVVETVDLFAEESNKTSLPTDDPKAGDRKTVGVALEGKVNNHPNSRADLLISDHGVYGLIQIDDLKIDYMPHETDNEAWVQNVTLGGTADQPPADILAPTTTSTDASEVSIADTKRMTPTPIEEKEPFDVAIAVENAGGHPVRVLIDATASHDGDQVDRQFIGPYEIRGDDVQVRNVTMELARGSYNLTYDLHSVKHAAQPAPLDTATETIEVSRPLYGEPETYALAFEDQDTKLDDAVGVSRAADRIELETTTAVDYILVHRAWLVENLGSVTSETQWSPVQYEDESWARVDLSENRTTVSFATFELTTEPMFTAGDRDALQFTQRPMWISLDAETTTQSQESNRTNQTSPPPTIGVRIDDGNPEGQPIHVAKNWLDGEGIDQATYRYPGGERIPVERTLDHDLVFPPHFSLVIIEDFECPDDCTQGSPPSDNWTDETQCCGVWEVSDKDISGLNGVKAQGGNFDDHKFAHRDITNTAPPELVHWAHIDADGGDPDWHKLQWRLNGNRAIEINLRSDGSNNVEVTTPTTNGWQSTPFNTTEWLPVRAFDINWGLSSCSFDVQIGHKVVLTNVAFPVCKSSVNEVRIGSKGHTAEPWWVDAITSHDTNLVTSNVQFDVSKDVTDTHSNWEERGLKAFNEHDHVWENAPMYIDLRLEHNNPTGVNILYQTDCADEPAPVVQYADWLDGHSSRMDASVDAYQWWTGKDLTSNGDGAGCWGEALPNRVKQGNVSASVVEGLEYNNDVYNPDLLDHRGVVSGHELGHVYGQEGHIGVKDGTYNMMKKGLPKDYWFTEYTAIEIWAEFYLNAEYDGDNP